MNGYLLRASIALLSRLCNHQTHHKIVYHHPTTRLCNHHPPQDCVTIKPTTTMKKENIKTIINFIITVLTAIASTFCMQSCILK